MKKNLILLLIFALICSCIPVGAADFTIYVNKTFEDAVTNSEPTDITVSGAADVIIKEYAEKEKALFINKRANYAVQISNTVGAKGDSVVQFDIMMKGVRSESVVRFVNRSTKFAPVNIGANGEIKTASGKKYGTFALDKWVNIAVVYRKSVNCCDIYVDGRRALSDWRLEVTSITSIANLEMEFKPADEDSEIYIDNIRAYSGIQVQKASSFAKAAYNSASVEYVETSREAGDAVLIQYDFNKRSSGSVVNKSNLIEQRTEEFENGEANGFMHFEVYGSDDAYMDFTQNSEAPYIVYQADVRINSLAGPLQFFTFKLNPDSTFCWTSYVNAGGGVSLHNGKSVGMISEGEWHTLAAAYNFVMKTYDYYIDGKKVAENVAMGAPDKSNPNLMRIHSAPAENDFDLDNLFVYEGKEPRDISASSGGDGQGGELASIGKVWTQDSEAEKYLKGTLAFHAGSGAVYDANAKSYPENPAFIYNKVTYLPLKFTAEKKGYTVTWNAEENAAVYDGNITIPIGAQSITVDGKEIQLSSPVLERNGATYVPAEAFGVGKLLNTTVYTNWNGVVIIGGLENYAAAADKEISTYLMNIRPKADRIKQDFVNNGKANMHPRVMATQSDFDRIKNLIETDETAKILFENIKKQADGFAAQELQYHHLPDGIRLLSISRAVWNLVSNCALVYKITGDESYAERVWKEVENVALNFPDWNPSHYLDTGEMSMAFAVAYDWLYDYLGEDRRKVLLGAMKTHGLDVYLAKYAEKNWWTTLDSNWSFVCNGGGIALAIAVADDYPDESFTLIENGLRSCDFAFPRYAPDGGWYEGPGYWGYAMQYLCYMVASLDSGIGTDYDLKKNTGLSETMNFYLSLGGANRKMFNYSDSGEGTVKADYGTWLGHVFNQPSWVKMRIDLAKLGTDVTDMLFYYPEEYRAGEEIDLPLDSYYRNVEIATHRSSWTDNNMLWVGYKGAYTNQSHGHFDNGGFVFDLNGVRWAKELGSDGYTLEGYFHTDKSDYYRKRAEGHNTIVINPETNTGNEQDPNEVGRIVDFVSKDRGSYGVLDLSGPYKDFAKSVKRGFKVDDYRNSLTVRDELELLEKNNTVYWFMHTNITEESDIKINGNTAVLTDKSSGEQLYFEYITNAPEAELKVMDSAPLPSSPNPIGQGVNNGKKLAIVAEGGKNITITVKMYDNMLRGKGLIKEIEDTPIDKWTIDDGAMPEKPVLEAIYTDGTLMEGFAPETTSYRLIYRYTDPDPVFTYDADEKYIVSAEKNGETTTITVTDKENPIINTKYIVTVKKTPDIYDNLDEFIRVMPKSVKASRIPEPQNPPEKVLDGLVSTRFAVDGDGEWIELDMGEVTDIDCYAISYYMGTARDSYYDILISEDGQNYTTVFKGATSGLTDNFELFNTPLRFRYFKLVGHCNSAGLWNSPTEIAFLRNK